MSTTASQAHEALERANQIRFGRVALKRAIATGKLPVCDVIADPPAEALSWPVAQVLACQHGWGDHRTRKLLSLLLIRETKPLGTLTQNQRRRIIEALQGGGGEGRG